MLGQTNSERGNKYVPFQSIPTFSRISWRLIMECDDLIVSGSLDYLEFLCGQSGEMVPISVGIDPGGIPTFTFTCENPKCDAPPVTYKTASTVQTEPCWRRKPVMKWKADCRPGDKPRQLWQPRHSQAGTKRMLKKQTTAKSVTHPGKK